MIVLDPRISYQGLLADCEGDVTLRRHLDESRKHLHALYCEHYANTASTPSVSTPTQPSVANGGSPQKFNFTARYNKRARAVVDELEDYFKLAQESFEHCNPIQWWVGRRAQFPNLSRLARDILSIPGKNYSAVSFTNVLVLMIFIGFSRFCCGCQTYFFRRP